MLILKSTPARHRRRLPASHILPRCANVVSRKELPSTLAPSIIFLLRGTEQTCMRMGELHISRLSFIVTQNSLSELWRGIPSIISRNGEQQQTSLPSCRACRSAALLQQDTSDNRFIGKHHDANIFLSRTASIKSIFLWDDPCETPFDCPGWSPTMQIIGNGTGMEIHRDYGGFEKSQR